jgi:hypothetical protein
LQTIAEQSLQELPVNASPVPTEKCLSRVTTTKNKQTIKMSIIQKSENRSKLSLVLSAGIFVLLLATVSSCDDDNGVTLVVNSPAYYISQAEKKLNTLPAEIASDGQVVKILYATGVQKYKAVSASTSATGYIWSSSSTPQAYLFDKTNAQVGTHYAGVGTGPFWKLTENDVINGQLVVGVDSPDGAANIKWLLLEPKTNTHPSGVFDEVTHIQRITTIGGQPCTTLPADASSTCESDYQTVYVFRK